MEAQHGPELNLDGDETSGDTRYDDQEAHTEFPPEIEEPPDPWEADQEAADWLGHNEQQIQTAPTSTLPNPNASSDSQLSCHKSASERPLWGKPSDLDRSERKEEKDSGGEEDQAR